MRLEDRIFPAGFWGEVKATISLAWPMILTQLSQYMFSPIATIFCGHLGKIQLDAVALANSLINVTGLWIMVGLSSACDTLFAQIFGSRNRADLGVVLQRSILILLLALFPCWAIHLNAEAILLLLGQDPAVARLSGEYLLAFMPGLLFFSLYIPLSKYVQNQNIVIPNLIIGLVSNGMCVLFHYIFMNVIGMETKGSAISQALGYFSMMICTLIYILASGMYKDTWKGWTMDCLQEWGSFVHLSLFGMLMLCIEWWSFEIAIFLSGILGTTELGAQTIVFQIATLVYMIPLGVGIAASIRVGQYLGAGNADGAKTAARVAYVIIITTASIMAVLVGALKNQLPKIFTNVSDVIDMAARILPVLAVYMLFDGACGVGCGILRGMGRQQLGSAIIAITYSVGLAGGIPIMLFTDWEILGYWYALAVTLALEGISILIIINLTNWNKQVKIALERTSAKDVEDKVDETTAILGGSKNKYTSDETGMQQPTKGLNKYQLFCYRGLALFLAVSALAIGGVVRLTVGVDREGTNCTLPAVTQSPNSSLPFCNETLTA